MITKFNEYYKWDDDVTEKTIDLGILYEQQEGNIDHIMQILEYEFRPIQSNDEYKIIRLVGKYSNVNMTLYNHIIETDKKGILFTARHGTHFIFRRIPFDRFTRFEFKIRIMKRRFIPEDPYGEEEWDINEAYYQDLSPYEYGFTIPECVNIGWLDDEHDFEKGDVPDGFIDKLKRLPTFAVHAGFHNCPFCDGGRETWSSSIRMSISNDVVYLTPDMIVHYVRDHNYKPPKEFIDSVMNMDNMSDEEARRYINNLMLKHREHFDKIFKRKK